MNLLFIYKLRFNQNGHWPWMTAGGVQFSWESYCHKKNGQVRKLEKYLLNKLIY